MLPVDQVVDLRAAREADAGEVAQLVIRIGGGIRPNGLGGLWPS